MHPWLFFKHCAIKLKPDKWNPPHRFTPPPISKQRNQKHPGWDFHTLIVLVIFHCKQNNARAYCVCCCCCVVEVYRNCPNRMQFLQAAWQGHSQWHCRLVSVEVGFPFCFLALPWLERRARKGRTREWNFEKANCFNLADIDVNNESKQMQGCNIACWSKNRHTWILDKYNFLYKLFWKQITFFFGYLCINFKNTSYCSINITNNN